MTRITAALWLFAAALLPGLAGCGAAVKNIMVHSPNKGRAIDGSSHTAGELLDLMDVDRELMIQSTVDGSWLRVWIVEPDRIGPDGPAAPRGTILVLHGYRNESFWIRTKASDLTDAGYRAVMVDLRGHGGSGGDYVTYGAMESRDLVSVIDDLDHQGLLTEPLGVWGISMGGSTAIQYAARDRRVKAVVAVSPYTCLRDVVPHVVRVGLPIAGWMMSEQEIQQLVDEAAAEAGFNPDEADALAAIQSIDTPVLILHGRIDAIVPFEHGRRLHEAAPDHSRLIDLGLAGHFGAGADLGGAVKRESIAWFDQHLPISRSPGGT